MLGRLFQVRRGEATRAALLFAYLFLVITTYVVTKASRDALFLHRYSAARLPYADIGSALTVAVAMTLYLRISRYVRLRRPDTDSLASFFGVFNIYAGVLSLLTQLLVAPRLLRRFGLALALWTVPVALTISSLGVLIWGTLATALMLKGSDQVLRYSIDKSTVELLYLPVPARQMVRAKAFIDTIVWRLGDSLGALLVLTCVTLLGLSASQISAVSLVLLVCWMMAAGIAGRQYASVC